MNIFGLHIPFTKNYEEPGATLPNIKALGSMPYPHTKSLENLVPIYFDGEKTPQTLGTPYNFESDYYSMRARAWENYLKSDIVQNVIEKYCLWIVGSGLKLQSDIKENILRKFKINISEKKIDELQSDIEEQFRLFVNTKYSTYSKNTDLHSQAAEALKNAIIAGDVLCIMRYDGKRVNMEIVDGHYVQTPWNLQEEIIKRGNYVKKGVEYNKKGSHVAYWVKQGFNDYKRILAYGSKTGRRQAWLMYGRKYKPNDTRGISLFSSVMETIQDLDRYRSATVKAAEENAKVPYTVEHGKESTEESPFKKQIAQSFGKDEGTSDETKSEIEDAATHIAQTTNSMVFEMPKDSKLSRHEGSSDKNYGQFLSDVLEIVYSSIGIPPEVARDKFEQNYSSSRAAWKSWEYKIMVERIKTLHKQYYKPFFGFWLDIQIMDNMINAQGYLQALEDDNYMILEAYRNCRFVGSGVPHIDPQKEAQAERTKLGKGFKNMPLTTVEQAMENLNTGDFSNNIKKTKNEKKQFTDFDPPSPDNGGGSGNSSV